jgi:hypothetical protein
MPRTKEKHKRRIEFARASEDFSSAICLEPVLSLSMDLPDNDIQNPVQDCSR